MNIVFLTMNVFTNIEMHNIYSDLMKEFIAHGHKPYIVTPREKKSGEETRLEDFESYALLKVRIGNTSNVSFIEKGISTVLLQSQFMHAISKHLSGIHFDLILYSTPPITLAGAVQYIKKRNGAKTYLLLKDIFPQNAVDIGMMSKTGVKGLLYQYFRAKEKKLYDLSDKIGCMSPANVEFVLKHNPNVPAEKVEVCPNSIDPIDMSVSMGERIAMREKYGIPLDKKVFVYGGNLGKPQGIPFLIECLKNQANNEQILLFLIVGDGTEYGKLDAYIRYDYTLYFADYQVLDGGMIENTDKSLTEVMTDILS